jgi:PAS domain S-box-containing protein
VATATANILLVDDRTKNLLALEAILEPLGQTLVSVESGEAALRELLQREFACILLDVQMPDLDGFETAELIKQRERSRHIPIIFVTAISKDEQHVFRGYSAGAVDYIFKPIDPEVLRSKVSVFIDLWEKTEQLKRQAEQIHQQELAQLQRASEERHRQVADAMPQIVWTADANGHMTSFNERWFEYTGLAYDAPAEQWLEVVHPDDRADVAAERARMLESLDVLEVEARFRSTDGAYRWHLGRAVPIRDEAGEVLFWAGTATDIHDRKRTEEAQQFLLDAGAELTSSLDYHKTLGAVARLAVPQIADWCSVVLVEDDGSLRELVVVHSDPNRVTLASELQERYPPDPDAPRGAAAVMRTGEPELLSDISDELLREVAVDELHLDLLRGLGITSAISVPLIARGRTLGAITLVGAGPDRRFGDHDLHVAEELARRAATAIDNAHLFRQAEERAEAARVLAAIGDGVFLLDRAGKIRLWNAAAERITGLEEAAVLGRPADEAIPGWQTIAARAPVARAGEAAGAESVPLDLGDREVWLSISAVGFEDGIVYALRDLTQERALEELRQDLVATVSHELRTPLAAIYGAALTLRRSDIELEEQLRDRLLAIIVDESNRLAEIVNDLLLASQLDSGRLQVNIERCDPVAIARTELEAARARLPESVALELETAGDVPAVAADSGQLRQVLANLIDNAIKYSPDGGRITVRLEPQGRHLRFAVADQGLGIPAGEERRIFEKFYRLDPDMTRGIGGTGLGLYICRELVRRVDGRIWVESPDSAGSTFFVEVPLAKAGTRKAPTASSRASAAA